MSVGVPSCLAVPFFCEKWDLSPFFWGVRRGGVPARVRLGGLVDERPAPVTLIGSSLGAFVAVNAAAHWPGRISRLVLLAPALDFGSPAMTKMGDTALEDWKASGTMNVFHFGYGRFVPVHYALYEDARQYDAMHAQLTMPTLVFQGRRDDVVDPVTVERWASSRPNVELHLLDDGHQLTASLPQMAEQIVAFVEEDA